MKKINLQIRPTKEVQEPHSCGLRLCPQCGMEVSDPLVVRCPRCWSALPKMNCGNCRGCPANS